MGSAGEGCDTSFSILAISALNLEESLMTHIHSCIHKLTFLQPYMIQAFYSLLDCGFPTYALRRSLGIQRRVKLHIISDMRLLSAKLQKIKSGGSIYILLGGPSVPQS